MLLSPSKIKEILRMGNIAPRKRWGQNFLISPHVLQKIIEATDPQADNLIIEIGPGLGVVTEELAKEVNKVIAIDLDAKLLEITKTLLKDYQNIEYISKNFLRVNLDQLVGTKKYKIVSNLPYYITTPIIEKITHAANKPAIAILMVQHEVAQRMMASPGTKDFGSFSIFVQYHWEIEKMMGAKKGSFFPPPKVNSTLLRLKRRTTPPVKVKNKELFFLITRSAFKYRRKNIRNVLKSVGIKNYDEILAKTNIDYQRRGETFSLEEFARLANTLPLSFSP